MGFPKNYDKVSLSKDAHNKIIEVRNKEKCTLSQAVYKLVTFWQDKTASTMEAKK